MRVYLRAFELDDYKKSVKWRNDRSVTKTLGANYYYISSEREKKWVENAINDNKTNIRLAICIKESDEYIGNIYLNSIDWINRNAEFSIFIGDMQEWGKGYATEATQLMLEYGFFQLDLQRIYLKVLEYNEIAINMYKKIGFKIEGIMRKCLFKDNTYHNLILMSILKEEFKNS